MTDNGLALAALNEEARRRKMNYGNLVALLTKEEQEAIVEKYRKAQNITRRQKK